jgi:hypothetical protein
MGFEYPFFDPYLQGEGKVVPVLLTEHHVIKLVWEVEV